ncbi:delta-lactam-biosynthetic de-N-acetylase [Paenibacillaceae bacterium]|nr:delta-lactam-biosynthetic de-N-acetylase [Paenibacillaceae bacterium]
MKRVGIALLLGILLCSAIPGLSAAAPSANKAFHFGFKKSVDGAPASIAEEGFQSIIKQHGAIFMGDSSRKNLYLTFDNGYENGYTSAILDVLQERGVPAAFFVTGHYVATEPELVKRMLREGHIVGNHSWSHPDMTTIGNGQIKQELTRVQDAVTQLTGQPTMRFLRPPRGIFNERTLKVTRELGYTNVFWSVAYKDWETQQQKGWKYALTQVMSQLHPGAVILLHSVSKDNAEAIGAIIEEARKQGYEFRSLEMLSSPEK